MKKIILLAMVIIAISLSGCISRPEIINSSTIVNASTHPGAPKTIVIYELDNAAGGTVAITFIVGNLTDVRYPSKNDITYKDALIFEDGTIVLVTGASNFDWELNRIYAIAMRDDEITSVNIYK